MRLRSLLSCAVALALTGSAFGAATTSWIKTSADSLTWLTAAGNGPRGLCYNPRTGNVLVAGTVGANNIQVINGASGTIAGTMNVTGITGGVGSALTKVRVVDYGTSYAVYACNLVTNNKTDTAGFKIYRWASVGTEAESTLAAPTVIYANDASDLTVTVTGATGPLMPAAGASTHRIGDSMDVVSSGSSVQIFAGRSDAATQNSIYRFDYTNGAAAVSAVTNVALTGGTGATYRGSGVDGYGGQIYHFSNGVFGRYNNDGTSQSTFSTYVVPTGAAMPKVGTLNGRKVIGFVDATTLGGGGFRRCYVDDINDGVIANTAVVDVTPLLGTAQANGNATGDVDFAPTSSTVFALVTNNYVGAFTISNSGTKTWVGAAGGDWNTASNWSGGVVPNGGDNVTLDNSSLAGSYTVTINVAGNINQSCRTLKIQPGASNVITLQIGSLSDTAEALRVSGDLTTGTDDILVDNGGKFTNSTGSTAGSIYFGLNPGQTFHVKAGGYLRHNTARSFSTPWPATGNGATTFDAGSTMEFAQPTASAVTYSGRSYGNLVIASPSGSVTYTAAGAAAVTIANDLTVGGTTTADLSGFTGTTTIGGKVSVASGSTLTMGNVIIAGSSSSPTLTGGGTATLNALTVSAAAGLGVGASTTLVNGTSLATTGGPVNLNASAVAVLGTASTTGALTGSFGYVAAIGSQIKEFTPAAASTLAFPVTIGGVDRSTTVAFTSAPTVAGSLTYKFTNTDPTTAGLPLTDGALNLTRVAPEGFYTITSGDGLAGGTYSLSLSTAGIAGITTPADIRIVKRTTAGPGAWTLDGTGSGATGVATRTGMSGFSDFGIASEVTQLPVGLGAFSIE